MNIERHKQIDLKSKVSAFVQSSKVFSLNNLDRLDETWVLKVHFANMYI